MSALLCECTCDGAEHPCEYTADVEAHDPATRGHTRTEVWVSWCAQCFMLVYGARTDVLVRGIIT